MPPTTWRNGSVSQTWRSPAVTSRVKWCSGGAGFSSCTRMRERKKTDAANVAESSTATAPPPSSVYSPAPASGAMIRRPSAWP